MDLTQIQLRLLDYIKLYESLDEMDPKVRPENEVIDDDSKLDAWLIEYSKKVREEAIHGHRPSAADHPNMTLFNQEYED